MHIQPLFTNFLAIDMLELDNASMEAYALDLKSKQIGRQVSNAGGWQGLDLDMSAPEVKPLFDIVQEKLNELHRQFEFADNMRFELFESWVNVNDKHHFNYPHTHAGSFFSGVYYVKSADNAGDIEFVSPIAAHEYTITTPMVKNFNEFNSNTWQVTPHVGKLILFPSWLTHFVRANHSDENRISISFNSRLV